MNRWGKTWKNKKKICINEWECEEKKDKNRSYGWLEKRNYDSHWDYMDRIRKSIDTNWFGSLKILSWFLFLHNVLQSFLCLSFSLTLFSSKDLFVLSPWSVLFFFSYHPALSIFFTSLLYTGWPSSVVSIECFKYWKHFDVKCHFFYSMPQFNINFSFPECWTFCNGCMITFSPLSSTNITPIKRILSIDQV